MGLLDGFEKLINEHGSAAILKERISLANDKYAALEAKNKVLRSENEALRLNNEQLTEQNGALEKQLLHKTCFAEEAGAMFKKNPDGTYNQTPYCPACQTAMVSPGRHELFRCGRKSCGQLASFKGVELGDIMCRLP